MPNLGGQALDYIKGLGNIGKAYMGANAGLGERAGKALGNFFLNPYVNRTGLGAIGGGLAGGIFGGQRGSGFSFSGAAMGAGLGAAGARYGGRFMRSGMTSGISLSQAARHTGMLGRSDFRAAMMQGRAARGFIGRTITSGIGRIQGLGR